MVDLLLVNGFAYIEGRYCDVSIGITGEKISYIGRERVDAKRTINLNHSRIYPGFIDPHVHFELKCGDITSRDNFYFGGKSAVYGGVTTIVDFLDPSRNADELQQNFVKRLALAKQCGVDYHFHACLCEPNGNLRKYVLKMKELGINTVKVFTTYSETHRQIQDKDLIKLLKLSRRYNFVVCAHIEKDEYIKHDKDLTFKDLPTARKEEAETEEALKLCRYAVKTKGHLYMVHCSSGRTLKAIVHNYKKYLGKNIFIESCPQYFVFNKESLEKENGCLFTFAPPLRDEESRKMLCKYIDYVDYIGTDHCSFNKEDKMKKCFLSDTPLGVGGIETSFLTMYELFGEKIIDKMTKNVAKIQRFAGKDGIKVGNYADLVVMSSDPQVVKKPHGNSDYSIYEGLHLSNTITSTLVRGKFALKDGQFYKTTGQLIYCEKK